MLDELLGRGLSSKCKSLIKLIQSRLDTIRRKRNCTLKILRTDVADLLTRGQEMKAFDRAEVFITEQSRSTAYDMVEQFCASILSNLPAIQKQRECPPESMEAVASLMFAAARFADLPELRNLRGIFSERYGIAATYNAADLHTFPGCAVNQEFAEIFSSKPPSTDKKLKLMREISKDSSIEWDSKAFEERVKNPHASTNVAAGKQLPQLNEGQKHGDDVAHDNGSQDQFPYRNTETPPEYAREKNVRHDPIAADVHQEILSHRKSEQPMEHSRKTTLLYNDTINEKDKRLHQRRNSRKSEPSLHHLKEPDCELDDTLNGNYGRKEQSRRKNELSQGYAVKSDRRGGDMLDERFDPDVLSHGRCKERSDYEIQEMWNDAADKRVKKTWSNNREATLDISSEPKKTPDEAYERDELERLSHRSKSPYLFTKTTEKMHEGSYKGNAHESLPHRPMVEHQENLTQRRKPPFTNDKTAADMNETKDYANAESFPHRSDHGPGDRQEELVHRPPYSYKTTTKKMPYKGNGHESYDKDNYLQRSKPEAGMHEDANYRGNDPSTFSPRSPLGGDQQMLHNSKPSYAYKRTPEMVHQDTFHEGYDHESTSHHRRPRQFDNDEEKRHHRSKPPHGNRTAKIHVDAYYDENEWEILPQRNQSPLYDDQKVCHKGKLRLHDDKPYDQNNHETLSDRTQSPLGDKKEKLSRRSKSPRPYTRATDNISNDVLCRETDYETLLDESRSAECRRTQEKIGDGTILRKGKRNTSARKSEASVDHLAELDEVDNAHVPTGFDVHLRTEGREELDNLKARIKNVKPPYVILTDQKVSSYSEDADGRNDHQNADYRPASNTKGDAEKEMKPNHNRIIRPPPYVVSTKGGKSKNGAEGRRADVNCEQDDEILAADDDSAYRVRAPIDRPCNRDREGGRVNRFDRHREAIAEHDTAHRDKFLKPASVRQRHPQAYVNTDEDDDYPPHHMKHDKHKPTRRVLDQSEDGVHEAGYSRSRHKYREETSHGVDLVDDKPRRHHGRPVQHHLNEEDEDKIMDELLLHYSQKGTPQVANDIQVGSKPPSPPIAGVSGHTSARRRSATRAGSDPRLEFSRAPNRAVSLAPEQSQSEEKVTLHVRATSMQPDMYNGHVHPKLPDYDDLAVRFAALRRQSNG
ncbi:uncharacterized protein LOC116250257 [Nymphaea colorata]|nr:uncharacterized protein LOC116250257 [Nymphaea colorata]